MKVFISWSGDTSKALAEILKQWLPAVIQAVRPYYSPDDVAKGARWATEISKELEESKIGIICLTRDNLEAPWIMFEAGALSKRLDKSRVCPILFGVDPSDIKGPLVQFQASRFERTEIKRVVKMINNELGDASLGADVLDSVYDMWWPKLEERVSRELEGARKPASAKRSERDMLEEVLALSRSIAHRSTLGPTSPRAIIDLVQSYCQLVDAASEAGAAEVLRSDLAKLLDPLEYISRRMGGLSVGRAVSSQQLAKVRKVLADLGKATEAAAEEADDEESPF